MKGGESQDGREVFLKQFFFRFHFFRFSGLSASDLDGVTTTLRDAQAVLLSMFSSKTILIGHSLESDLKALKVEKLSTMAPSEE